MVLSRMDDLPRGAWVALVVLGFWFWWPAGVAALGYLAFARREGRGFGRGRWQNVAQDGVGQGGAAWGWTGCGASRRAAPTSGNQAFDAYRAETLKRLEDEQKEFVDYLERLRQARDKSEFDAYMAERRGRPAPTPPAEAA